MNPVPHSERVAAAIKALPLPDVPLIVEDLLMEAQQLADANAPREALEEILGQVAALREGRG